MTAWDDLIFVFFSKQVKEEYTKWWKAKVKKSLLLSKHFGAMTSTSARMVRL